MWTHWKWPSDTRIRNFEKTDGNRTCSIFIRQASWKMKGADKFCMISLWSFWRQIEDALSVLKIGSCEHTTSDFRHSHHKNGTLKSDRLNACSQFSEPIIGSLNSDRVNGPIQNQRIVSVKVIKTGFSSLVGCVLCSTVGEWHVGQNLTSDHTVAN